jgi:hypothetical protein
VTRVRSLGEEHLEEVTGVLADSFADYPVLRYVLGRPGAGDAERAYRLVRYWVRARIVRQEPIFGTGFRSPPKRSAT